MTELSSLSLSLFFFIYIFFCCSAPVWRIGCHPSDANSLIISWPFVFWADPVSTVYLSSLLSRPVTVLVSIIDYSLSNNWFIHSLTDGAAPPFTLLEGKWLWTKVKWSVPAYGGSCVVPAASYFHWQPLEKKNRLVLFKVFAHSISPGWKLVNGQSSYRYCYC